MSHHGGTFLVKKKKKSRSLSFYCLKLNICPASPTGSTSFICSVKLSLLLDGDTNIMLREPSCTCSAVVSPAAKRGESPEITCRLQPTCVRASAVAPPIYPLRVAKVIVCLWLRCFICRWPVMKLHMPAVMKLPSQDSFVFSLLDPLWSSLDQFLNMLPVVILIKLWGENGEKYPSYPAVKV